MGKSRRRPVAPSGRDAMRDRHTHMRIDNPDIFFAFPQVCYLQKPTQPT